MGRDFQGGMYIGIGNPIGPLDVTGTQLTVAAFAKPAALGGFQYVVAKATSIGSCQYDLDFNGANPRLVVGDAGGNDVLAGSGGANGVWQHIAGIKQGTTGNSQRVYLNGVLSNQTTGTRVIQDTTNSFVLGNRSDTGFPFTGVIAQVCLWNVALTDAEILALAKGVCPLHVRPANLGAYYPLWGPGPAGVAGPSVEPDLTPYGEHIAKGGAGSANVANHGPCGPYAF